MSAYSSSNGSANSPNNNVSAETTGSAAVVDGTPAALGAHAKKKRSPNRELASSWLSWQCQMISGVIRGAVFDPEHLKPSGALSLWPESGLAEAQLVAAATQALKKNNSTCFSKITYGPNKQRLCDVVACPVYKEGSLCAIVTVAFSVRSEPQQQAVLQLLRWGGLWLETLLDKNQDDAKESNQIALQLVNAVSQQQNTLAACIEASNKLADAFACKQVSIGLRDGMLIHLKSLSNTANFDSRTQFIRQLEAAMEEACDRRQAIAHPGLLNTDSPARAHAELVKQHGCKAVLTVPLINADQVLGAVCFEQSNGPVFDVTTARQCESITQLLCPIIAHKMQQEKPLLARATETVKAPMATLLGNKYFKVKMLLLLLAVGTFIAANTQSVHKVNAPASIMGSVRQLIVAPQDGYIQEAAVRAGDDVRAGDLLAKMQDRNLTLELNKQQSLHIQISQEYREALAQQDRTAMSVLKAQLQQVDADILLAQQSLQRTHLVAPFDGVVVSGDLSQSLGSPVDIGQVLFEVAPLENYRVILEVPEQDIGSIKAAQSGQLVVSALPSETFDFHVEQIIPLAASNNSGNYFQVEAQLTQSSDLLRPGMRGSSKIFADESSLLWIWTHHLTEKLRILAWTLGI